LQEEKEFIQELLDPKTQNEAFQKLLHTYQRPLYYHIRNIVLNHDDTDDVLQNTFIKVFQNLKNFKGESKLFSWMYRIATNESLTFIKQKAKKNNTSTEEINAKIIDNLQSDVFFDGKPVARDGDVSTTHQKPSGNKCVPHVSKIIARNSTVFINGRPIATVGDRMSDCTQIIQGSETVVVG
jgi:RNA polymerase sigma factor (sigma-70 family)